MTLRKGDKLRCVNWGNYPDYEIVSDPFYLTDGDGKDTYVVSIVLKEVKSIG